MNIHWTDTAIQHLSAIHDYIAFDSQEYASPDVNSPS